jgi:SAM-dependent methyltransferase
MPLGRGASDPEQTRAAYDAEAAGYDSTRSQELFERPWLERALADVPQGAAVLDLGCGTGAPIGVFLNAQGYALTGVDFSTEMLAQFRARLPGATAICTDMRALDLGQQFDAIIDWGAFFHLTMEEQRAALPRIAGHLAPGGRLLLTVGPEAGEAHGFVGDSVVFHASLSPAEYRAILWISRVEVETFVPNDPDCRGFTILLARRTP